MGAVEPKTVDFLVAVVATVLAGQLFGIAWQAMLLVLA
jgi:hypothetical protein